MPGPLDIYEENYHQHSSPVIPDMGSFFSNPLVLGAGIVTDLFLKNRMLSRRGMTGLMNPLQRRRFIHDVFRQTHGVSARNFERFMMTSSEKGLRHGATFASRYGGKAAARMATGRALVGFSKFATLYGMAELGMALGGMIGDAISAYEPTPYTNKRRTLETGGIFADTRQAQTQRMRAIQAIHNTQLSTRAAMGNEAAFMHLER